MLNRRLARIRAMQALYALEKSKGANFLLAQDLIAEAFAPDLNSMEKQDRNKLSGLVKLSQSLFEDEIKKGIFTFDDGTPVEIRSVLSKAREFLKHKNKKDFDFHSLQTILDAERTYDVYLYILNMLVLLGNKPDSVLYSNRVIKSLSLNKDLEVISLKRSVSLENESSVIQKLYSEAVKSNSHVQAYLDTVNKTVEDDLAVVKYLVKNVILKHEITNDFFEKLHIFWSEDRDILRTMVFHTFNDFIDTQEVHIEKLEEQWEETKDFLRVLFKETAANNEEHQRLIMPHIKNWDVERIIETDLILLKMAITEWTHFNSIPVKVTINEIIEISKNYSSEKSKIFINGVLDSLYKDLNGQNLIKKTGRGMLDNK
jgi:N utilization substance protein B